MTRTFIYMFVVVITKDIVFYKAILNIKPNPTGISCYRRQLERKDRLLQDLVFPNVAMAKANAISLTWVGLF